DRPDTQRLLPACRRFKRVPWSGERVEEGVALRIDLDTALTDELGTQEAPMLRQRSDVRFLAELVHKSRRALDIGEEKRDDAGRQFGNGHAEGTVSFATPRVKLRPLFEKGRSRGPFVRRYAQPQ